MRLNKNGIYSSDIRWLRVEDAFMKTGISFSKFLKSWSQYLKRFIVYSSYSSESTFSTDS